VEAGRWSVGKGRGVKVVGGDRGKVRGERGKGGEWGEER